MFRDGFHRVESEIERVFCVTSDLLTSQHSSEQGEHESESGRPMSEQKLVSLARSLFGPSRGEAQVFLSHAWEAPGQLSPSGVELLKDALAKGAVLWLVRNGAARERLWEKLTPPAIHFDETVVGLLQWLLEQPLGSEQPMTPLRHEGVASLGYELVLLAALSAARGTAIESKLVAQDAFRCSNLCQLAFPFSFAPSSETTHVGVFSFDAEREFILAALQPSLAQWWRDGEHFKATLNDAAELRGMGLYQHEVLSQLLQWADAQQLYLRCTFLLEAFAPLLNADAQERNFVPALSGRMSLQDRQSARTAAASPLLAIERLAEWEARARLVRFIDDGYEQAQQLVKTFESAFGAERFARARQFAQQLASPPA